MFISDIRANLRGAFEIIYNTNKLKFKTFVTSRLEAMSLQEKNIILEEKNSTLSDLVDIRIHEKNLQKLRYEQ